MKITIDTPEGQRFMHINDKWCQKAANGNPAAQDGIISDIGKFVTQIILRDYPRDIPPR